MTNLASDRRRIFSHLQDYGIEIPENLILPMLGLEPEPVIESGDPKLDVEHYTSVLLHYLSDQDLKDELNATGLPHLAAFLLYSQYDAASIEIQELMEKVSERMGIVDFGMDTESTGSQEDGDDNGDEDDDLEIEDDEESRNPILMALLPLFDEVMAQGPVDSFIVNLLVFTDPAERVPLSGLKTLFTTLVENLATGPVGNYGEWVIAEVGGTRVQFSRLSKTVHKA